MTKPRNIAQQQGAYTLLTVFVLLMSIGALGVLAVGHTAWEKSRIQGVADLVSANRQVGLGDTCANHFDFVQLRFLRQHSAALHQWIRPCLAVSATQM